MDCEAMTTKRQTKANRTWPIKIFTLGKFEIISTRKSPSRSRKAQHKPLNMLKSIIAFGGKSVSKEALTDVLWPDSEGDAATQSFATTLHRLRKLLGNKKAIKMRESLVSLNPEIVWLDTWAFESVIDEVRNDPDQFLQLLEKALPLYHGHFLPTDYGEPWTTSIRERLRSKFLRNVGKICEHWEKQGDLERAVDCYLKALEVDDLSEKFYRNLMANYIKLGQNAEAVSVYNRCLRVFEAALGVKPSEKTRAIYRSIISE
jgi:two-component SAPR family response regulator